MVYYLAWVIVSAEIKRSLYEKLKEYGIPISDIIRRALVEEVQRREEEARRALRKAQEILKKIPSDEIVKLIRSSREEQ